MMKNIVIYKIFNIEGCTEFLSVGVIIMLQINFLPKIPTIWTMNNNRYLSYKRKFHLI